MYFDVIELFQLQNNANLNCAIRAPYFAGYSAAICSQIPYGMAVFGTYETLKTSAVKMFPDAPKLPVYLGCAVAGDIMGSLVLTPGEVSSNSTSSELLHRSVALSVNHYFTQVIKQKVQAGQHKSVLSAFRSIVNERGIAGLYQVTLIALLCHKHTIC
jgi:hypothetical protein